MSRRTIVVVEDEATIAGAIAARLRAEGFDVETAGDGPSGVELCARLAPDLVILDWMLPGFDGVEACRRIQADRPVPVVFLTARDAESDVLVGLGIGADDYAYLRLDLVQDAYGLTRVRYGGGAMLLWLTGIFFVVLAAGTHAAVARRAPRIALVASLMAIVGFSLANPDGRIAASALARAEQGKTVDREYLRGLSADALPTLRRLPGAHGEVAPWRDLEQRLQRRDGPAGLDRSRSRAR